MDFRQIPEVPLSLCAITSRDLRFLGAAGPGRAHGRLRGFPEAAAGPLFTLAQAPAPTYPVSSQPSPALNGGDRCASALGRQTREGRGLHAARWGEGSSAGPSPPRAGGYRGAPGEAAAPGRGGAAGAPRPAPSPASPASSQRRTQLVRARDPLPAQPSPGGAGRGKVRPVLTEDAVFLQGAVDLAAGVDLQVVLGGTVELPAAGRSPEVLVDAAAPPRIPRGPRGGRSGRDARLGQQGEQQEPDHEHRGMVAAALSPRGSGGSGRAAPGLPLTASG